MNFSTTTFDGRAAIEIKTRKFKMTVVTACGPRIACWGRPQGKNLLFWDTADRGRGAWKLRGGHRVWPTRPLGDESEDAYRPDDEPCTVRKTGKAVVITGAVDPILGIQKGLCLELKGDNKIMVDNFIINTGDMLFSGGVWALTCTIPGWGRAYGIPLGDGSAWDGFRMTMFRQWGGHKGVINDPQVVFTEDMLIIKSRGKETKRMIEAPYGILAMDAPDQKTTFIKKVVFQRGAQYPMSCNMAFYIGPGNFMVEMETMGPEATLKPGETIHNVEHWILTDRALGVKNAETLIKAAR